MKTAKTIISLLLILAAAQKSNAQEDSLLVPQPVEQKEKTSVLISSNFASKLHYFGRTDSLKSTALIPNIFVQFGNGLFLSSSAVFISNSHQTFKYAATVAGAGYSFGKTKGLAGSVFADKFFYAEKNLVQSSQQGQAGFKLAYLNSLLDINLAGSTVFADKSDYFTSVGVDHIFRFKHKNAVFVLIPSFTANAGTQNFTRSYYNIRSVYPLPALEKQITESGKRFQLLSYEASMPVVCVYKKFIFTVTPGFVIPQNVLTVNGRPDLSENASNMFYANVGIAYKFSKK